MSTPSRPIWEGIFRTFAEAEAEASVFEDPKWLARVVERAKELIARRTGGSIPPVAVTTDYALPFVAAIAARPDRPLRVLDFGGSLATSFVSLREMLPKNRVIEFVVVENAAVCEAGRELFSAEPNVTFTTELPDASARFDIVHFGSSLHYVDEWEAVLARAASYQPEWFLVVDLPAADNVSFVTTQQFQERRIPVRFWNLAEFVESVRALGFEHLFQARFRGYYSSETAERPTENFDEAHRMRFTAQLIFRRIRTEE